MSHRVKRSSSRSISPARKRSRALSSSRSPTPEQQKRVTSSRGQGSSRNRNKSENAASSFIDVAKHEIYTERTEAEQTEMEQKLEKDLEVSLSDPIFLAKQKNLAVRW